MQAQAEVGFIVVMVEGMGSLNRSKAFLDVAWKHIGDAGFPDRILWHQAVAAKYPYYDVVGELDQNVDPASTLQVVNALIKANKTFDLLVVPGEGHGAGRTTGPVEYVTRRQYDFFVRHLQGVDPPDWNRTLNTTATASIR